MDTYEARVPRGLSLVRHDGEAYVYVPLPEQFATGDLLEQLVPFADEALAALHAQQA